jgi:hypothetical protein
MIASRTGKGHDLRFKIALVVAVMQKNIFFEQKVKINLFL